MSRPNGVTGRGRDHARREEILDRVSQVVSTSGLTLSVHDIADASGILPGSLYHHFESKEAILVELVRRYRRALGQAAGDAAGWPPASGAVQVVEQVVELGRCIAECAMRHRAALLLTLYEPPVGTSDELVRLVEAPAPVQGSMAQILARGQDRGEVSGALDADLLAERICRSMFHHAIGHSLTAPGARQLPELRCRILLEGLAVDPPPAAALDRSEPLQVLRSLMRGWVDDDATDRAAHVRRVARVAFGRRGFRTTTMRDVATDAGLGVATVYRCYPSKEALLGAVMAAYGEARQVGWDAVMATSTPSTIEKLDALAYLSISLMDRYRDELRIQVSLLRERPGVLRRLGSTRNQRRALRQAMIDGERRGELRLDHGDADRYSKCLYELTGMSEHIVTTAGVDGAHALVRSTVLAGAVVGSTRSGNGDGRTRVARRDGSRAGAALPTG